MTIRLSKTTRTLACGCSFITKRRRPGKNKKAVVWEEQDLFCHKHLRAARDKEFYGEQSRSYREALAEGHKTMENS